MSIRSRITVLINKNTSGIVLQGIAYNRVTAAHLVAAAKHRLSAAKSYKAGDIDQADLSSFAALRHLFLAGDV
jgi:hypothetical protein